MPNSADFNRFAVNPLDLDIGRSMFNMDHTHKFSFNVGEVIPFEIREVLPGDTFTVDTTKVVRMQPMVAPIMDEIIFDTYFFFCPLRLVWNHAVNFFGENTESAWAPSTEYTIPKLTTPYNGFAVGTIADYLGVPPNVGGINVNALPFRIYALTMDQWFRAEALQDPVHVHIDDTARVGVNSGDQVTDIELGGKPFIAGKFPDYFTSALPSPQRGDAISPFANLSVPVYPSTNPISAIELDRLGASDKLLLRKYSAGTLSNLTSKAALGAQGTTADGTVLGAFSAISSGATDYVIPTNLRADVSNLTSFTINDLRTAFAIQKYLEKSARFGGRYIEYLKGFFGVDSPDARLQRVEYLGGSRMPLNVNSIQQTSATTTDSTPQGNPSGLSVTGQVHSDFTKSFTEHGFILGVCVARYHHTYSQGMERFWFYNDYLDVYNPVFANLGEMPVFRGQLYATGSNDGNRQVFGYQEAWAHYRNAPNRVSGEMRPGITNSLAMWHLADYYTSAPTLSAAWIREDKAPVDRTLAVTSDVSNQLFADILVEMDVARAMPLYSIPGLIDHH